MPMVVRCFTCGDVLANKHRYFMNELETRNGKNPLAMDKPMYLTVDMLDKPLEKSLAGKILDDLKIVKPCCRRHMITYVDDLD